MPLLKVNATATGLRLHQTSVQADYAINDMANCAGPAIIMVHGFKYAPGSVRHCPHRKLFNTSQNAWPKGFGFGQSHAREGVAIALGWYARGPLNKVHHRASILGEDLARIVTLLRKTNPARPVHIVAHSLGAEVVLSAMMHLHSGSIDRVILLTGACFQHTATNALATSAGRTAEVLNVVSGENDLFDVVFERLVRSERCGDRAIGRGIVAPNVVNLQIDCSSSLEALNKLSFPIAAADRTICHWSAYRRDGLMALYNRFLRNPEALPLSSLLRALPQNIAPRWSRFMPDRLSIGQSERLQQVFYDLGFPACRKRRAPAGRREREHAC